MYPYECYSYYGIHVKEQIDSIRNKHGVTDTVLFINGRISKLSYLLSIVKANYLVYKGKVDVIHIHFGLSGLFLLFNPFLKVPVVVTLHGSDVNTESKLTKFIVKKVISRCNKTIVMNNQMYEDVKPFAKSLEVIPCGIDLDFFKPNRKTVNQNLVIGFPGNPERTEKNYGLFSTVVKQLEKQGYNIEIVIFHNLSRVEVVNKLNYIDILLLTSFNEGSPQIIKEALACNTSIVSVPVGDIPHVLSGIDNCRVTKDHEPKHLLKSTLEIIQKENSYQKTNAGREKLKVLNLDQQSIAAKIYNCYKQLVK